MDLDKKIEKFIIDFYQNEKFVLQDNAEIKIYKMERDYFLDVFGVRFEISLDLNKPIKGLKETLDIIQNISDKQIAYITVKTISQDMIIYTDLDIEKVYGIINFI